ncbi:hypothetical protein HanIR_Chr06g0271821 [Helianthus annuus]|nr:hypothetical protein HanIR_Chr06g0271821 [Helianthus annuus]
MSPDHHHHLSTPYISTYPPSLTLLYYSLPTATTASSHHCQQLDTTIKSNQINC